MKETQDIFKHLDELNYELKHQKKSIKDATEDRIEEDFNLKLENYFKNNIDFVGKFNNYTATAAERLLNFKSMLDYCVEQSMKGIYTEGHDLHMKDRYCKNLLREAERFFNYEEKQALRANLKAGRTNSQAYLNERSIGSTKENKETTMQGIKTKIQKINIIESLGIGEKINYSSNIKTPKEIAEFKNLKPSKNKDSKNKQMSDEDYNKIFNPIFTKLVESPEKINEAEAAFILCGEFGFRPSTVLRLGINAVDVQKCTIDVYAGENKSKQLFQAKTSSIEPVNQETQLVLSKLRERALLLYKEDASGNINLVSCCEQNLHQGFTSLCKKYGVNGEKYQGKYKTLRHRFAQNIYTEHRQEYQENNNMTEVEKKAKALVETNYLLGHSRSKISTTLRYIKVLW